MSILTLFYIALGAGLIVSLIVAFILGALFGAELGREQAVDHTQRKGYFTAYSRRYVAQPTRG